MFPHLSTLAHHWNLFLTFSVSQLSAVSSPSAVHSAAHTFLSLLVVVYLGAGISAAVRDSSGEPVPASCLAEAGSLTSAACSRLARRLLGLLLSLPPISLWELWDYSADADQHIQLVTGALVSRPGVRPGRQSAQTH